MGPGDDVDGLDDADADCVPTENAPGPDKPLVLTFRPKPTGHWDVAISPGALVVSSAKSRRLYESGESENEENASGADPKAGPTAVWGVWWAVSPEPSLERPSMPMWGLMLIPSTPNMSGPLAASPPGLYMD